MALRPPVASAGVLAACLALATPANATPTFAISTTGAPGSYSVVNNALQSPDFGTSYFGTTDGLTFYSTEVNSNAPGTPSYAETLQSTSRIENDTANAVTVYITFGDTGFTMPSAPPSLQLSSFVGATYPVASAASSIQFSSFVSADNGQNSTTGIETSVFSSNLGNGGSTSGNQYATVTSITTPYSMTELLILTLAAGDQINLSTSTTLTQIPEPAALGLLGVGLAGIGLIHRRRT